MLRVPFDPPYTADDIPQLDALHQEVALEQDWLESDVRANLLGHKMVDGPAGRECDICFACTCHSKDFLQKACEGLQLKKKEQPE